MYRIYMSKIIDISKKKTMILFGAFFYKCAKVKGFFALYQKHRFAECGNNVTVENNCEFIESHIHCGNNVYIGQRCSFIASIAHIYIGDYVLFGPNVTIRGGGPSY